MPPIVEARVPWLIQVIVFQLLWLMLVFAAVKGGEIVAITCVALWLSISLFYSCRTKVDITLLIAACILGPLADTLLLNLQLVRYVGYAPAPFLPPLWIVALWANFALFLHNNMSLFRNHPYLLAFISMVSAPLAYVSGAYLGAAQLANPIWQPLCVVAFSWGVILPLLALTSNALHKQHAKANA